ncbi:hypothetical protein [Rhodoblastus sphagnicola]|nr:hypothetical protein [Rhodoblastus sphagnicola]
MKAQVQSLILRGGLATVAAISTSSFAGAADLSDSTKAAITAPAPASPFSWDAGVLLTNYYVERGVFISKKGAVFEPYGDLYYKLYQGGGVINSVTAGIGYWASLTTAGVPASANYTGFQRDFTEIDLIPSFAIQFADRFTLTAKYNHYASPSHGYGPGNWVNATLAYDDTGLTVANFSVQPYLNVLYELPGQSHSGLQPNAWYFEPGVSPNYTFFTGSKYPINFAIPIAFGLGSKFYAGQSYGYFAGGPQISIPLSFIPDQYGKWNASLAYKYWNLGTTTAAIAPGGNRNQSQVLFTISVKG